jgi:hypothetical protein
MEVDVIMGDVEDEEVANVSESNISDPDEFFSKNAFRVVYQTNNFFLPQIIKLLEDREVLNIRPEYQRRLRWTDEQKSKLIESLLLNIPIPPIFLYENSAARYEVMDGQQRLNAVREFFSNDYPLASLKVLSPLNGLRCNQCSPRIKRALDRSNLSAIVLLLESENEKPKGEQSNRLTLTDIRRLIFDRLNTGGTKLNPQEIRNALNPGNFNNVIIELTRFDLFTEVFGIPPYRGSELDLYYENPDRKNNNLYSTMGDCQLVLRYFALRDRVNIRGSMKSMLDRAMEIEVSDQEAEMFKKEFIERFRFLYDLFRRKPFVLPSTRRGKGKISAALYDASMVAINELWEIRDGILNSASDVQERMNYGLRDEKTFQVLIGRYNTASAVLQRIDIMRKIFLPE